MKNLARFSICKERNKTFTNDVSHWYNSPPKMRACQGCVPYIFTSLSSMNGIIF